MCNIIPAHLYSNLLKHGDAEERSFAGRALDAIKKHIYDPCFEGVVGAAPPFELETEREGAFRTIYDAQHKMELPGVLIRSEGEESNGDVTAEEAYDGAGVTWELLKKAFNRNSIDDKGMELQSTIHYGKNFANAYWNGTMVYGDGDGKIFNRFSSVVDVIGHEVFHGVTEYTAGLIYYAQPGALNEHFSDVFGSLVKQYKLKQTADQADWLIGAGLFTDKVNGKALRSMSHPGTAYNDPKIGKDPQPDTMSKYVKTQQDQAGVHINSGIPNRCFYNFAVNIGGNAWKTCGDIWYKALTRELKSKSQFQDMVNATVKVTTQLYGSKSIEQKALVEAWKVVELKPSEKFL